MMLPQNKMTNIYAAVASGASFLLLAALVWLLLSALPVVHSIPAWTVYILFAVASLAAYPVLRLVLSRGDE